MAVDSNFTSSLLHNLKLEDPWLPPKTWECIPSESGLSHSQIPNSKSPFQDSPYDPSTISEACLVRLALNALQGVEASLHSIETLSQTFSTDSADRTSHRIPSLWYRSSSTNALGKVLKSVGRSGFIAFLVRKFVDYFHHQNLNASEGNEGVTETEAQSERVIETNTHHASLVNQAFAVALGKVFEGFICALDTLNSSVKLRRSPENFDTSEVGCLTSVVHSGITFMEVYLHTRELRTQMETIGNICLFKNVDVAFSTLSIDELTTEATMGFRNFPKGANLLSYLYAQLRDADPAHHALLKFLFIHSCEPYYGFVKTWIYEARIIDPYNEFIIEYVGDSSSFSQGGASFSAEVSSSSIRVREGVSLPCFLENFCLPLLRAGQQLQVLIKLLEMCNCFHAGGQTYEDILPCWSGASTICLSTIPPFTFNKANLEQMVLMRENMYSTMEENLQILIASLDNSYQPMSSNVMPFSFSMKESLLNPTAVNGETDNQSETSGSVDDISYQADSFESSSECSSWNSSGEEATTEETTEHNDSSFEVELRNLSASLYFKSHTNGNKLPNHSPTENLSAPECVKSTTFEKMDPIPNYSDPPEKKKLSHSSEHYMSANATLLRFSKTAYDSYQSINFWPLGGISKNPFYIDGTPKGESQSHLIYSSLEEHDKNDEIFEADVPYPGELLTCDDPLPERAKGDIQFETETHASSNTHITTSWTLKYDNVFNINPMLTKNVWCRMIDYSGDTSSLDDKQSFISYFDFSSVGDPFMVYGKRSTAAPNYGLEINNLFFDSSVSSTKVADKLCGEQKCRDPNTQRDHINTLSTSFENRQEEKPLTSTSGGAKWESILSYLGKRCIHGSGDHHQSSGSTFNIPLDVIIEKCILREILLQYEYISNFTIKLLEEGFDLQEHLLALRRYHFMEFADWADLFIMSLWRHKWSVAEASEKISEIQGLLDLAVQRSSCVGDPYKERLYLYMKGHGVVPFSTPANGVHAFDFIALGYRVDWPVSIVLTPTALKTYADIFSFLIQVKLAVFSLTDVWCTMKDLDNLVSQIHHSGLDERDNYYINVLMRMRHQINHFVSTLQQYIQSELSHVSWCKLLHSLKHQVKDMFDLELVHMAYLADSLHICFLSDETQQVAGIIESILQCALDFRSCFSGGCWEVGPERRDSAKILGRLNISQVLTIKATFDKNLKELYLCYLKSPKHDEFSLCRFWGYLNYNDYYSSVIGNGLTHYAL